MDSNGSINKELPSMFTDLDPLGTGKSRPYVDKKDFFSELKTSVSPKLASNMGTSQDGQQVQDVPQQPQQQQQPQANVGQPPRHGHASGSEASSSSLSFVHNSSSQRSSLRSSTNRHLSGQQPTPPPRSGSELTYGHLDQVRRPITSNSLASHGVKGFGFSAHLIDPSTNPSQLLTSSSNTPMIYSSATMSRAALSSSRSNPNSNTTNQNSNPATNIASMAALWRTQQQPETGSSLQDTRLYHTLGRPMTTFTTKASSNSTTTTTSHIEALKVSLPPDGNQSNINPNPTMIPVIDTDRPESQQEEDNSYGSIPHLEASPRRYNNNNNKHKEMCEFQYDTSGPTLGIPVRHPGDGSSPSSDIPPKLPERPSKKATSSSPPPLPPKKPTTTNQSQHPGKGLIGVTYLNNRPAMDEPPPDIIGGHDIYDFPPMPKVGSMKLDQKEARQCISDILHQEPASMSRQKEKTGSVTIEELSRMSVMELNEKMQSGELPAHLKGMSIFDLVEFIGKHMSEAKARSQQQQQQWIDDSQQQSSMKPSFSDNFVSDHLAQPPPADNVRNRPSPLDTQKPRLREQSGSPGGGSINSPGSMGSSRYGYPPGTIAGPPPGMSGSVQSNSLASQPVSSGFDDDFAPFSLPTSAIGGDNAGQQRPSSQATSDHSVLSSTQNKGGGDESYDRYAAFRELQMEDELIRAWKTPSDEEDKASKFDNDNDGSDKFEDAQDDQQQDDGPLFKNPPICSSEGSPCSRSDSQSPIKSIPEDHLQVYGDDKNSIGQQQPQSCNLQVEERDSKRDSQVPIFHHAEEDDDSISQSTRTDHESYRPTAPPHYEVEAFQEETEPEAGNNDDFKESFFNDPSEPSMMSTSKQWTTFDEGPDGESMFSPEVQKTPVKVVVPASARSQHSFQDNFGDSSLSWMPPIEGNPEPEQTQPHHHLERQDSQHSNHSSSMHSRKHSTDSASTTGTAGTGHKCQRFSHRHGEGGAVCRGHSFEKSEQLEYTDWWPPSAEGAPKKQAATTSQCETPPVTVAGNVSVGKSRDESPFADNFADMASNPDKASRSSEVNTPNTVNNSGRNSASFYDENLDGQVKFKVFSRVVPGLDPGGGSNSGRSGTPSSACGVNGANDPISDSDSGIIPKSDSVNIFTIKDDPFDDDFFK